MMTKKNKCNGLYTNTVDLVSDFTEVTKAIELSYFKELLFGLVAANSLLFLTFSTDLGLRFISNKRRPKIALKKSRIHSVRLEENEDGLIK